MRAQRRGEGKRPAATFPGAHADFAGGPSSGGEARERGPSGGGARFLGSGEEDMRERWIVNFLTNLTFVFFVES